MGYIFSIMNEYFDTYWTRAINTSNHLRNNDPPYHYIYTTQSFLVSFYLNCINNTAWTYPARTLRL